MRASAIETVRTRFPDIGLTQVVIGQERRLIALLAFVSVPIAMAIGGLAGLPSWLAIAIGGGIGGLVADLLNPRHAIAIGTRRVHLVEVATSRTFRLADAESPVDPATARLIKRGIVSDRWLIGEHELMIQKRERATLEAGLTAVGLTSGTMDPA